MMLPARGVRDDGCLAQWRLHCSNTKTKAKRSARRGGKDTRGVCGHGLIGLRAFGSPRGLDLESQRVEWRSIDHHDERLDHLTCFCTNNLLPVPSFARAHQLYKLCTWICSFVCKMDKRLCHASCSAWCMEGRLELWAVVLHGRLDDFIGLTHRGGSEHRSQRGMCVNPVHGTFAAYVVKNSEVIVHHSSSGRMSARCVLPATAIVG